MCTQQAPQLMLKQSANAKTRAVKEMLQLDGCFEFETTFCFSSLYVGHTFRLFWLMPLAEESWENSTPKKPPSRISLH